MSDMFEWAKKEVALACEREKSGIKSDNDGMPTINPQEPKLDTLYKIRAEIDRQEKWLMSAGYNAYNVDIAFNSIKSVSSESEE